MSAPTAGATWMQQGTDLFSGAMSGLDDQDLSAPTELPGWSRRHVLAHVGFNALALRRLALWARTGEPHPMYASSEQRAAEIAEGATWDGARLRVFVATSAERLAADLERLDDQAWRREVVTAQGRTVPATEIPWMRTREVAVHAVDLGAGVTFDELPDDLLEALVDDVAVRRSTVGRDPALRLHSTSGRTWTIDGGGDRVDVTGTPAALARWLTGRAGGGLQTPEHRTLPSLTPWL